METVLSLDEQQSEANVETPEPQTEKAAATQERER